MVCDFCKEGIAEECTCFHCGEKGSLVKENDEIRDKINCICDDLDLDETRKDIWLLISKLIDNEIEQEKLCNQ